MKPSTLNETELQHWKEDLRVYYGVTDLQGFAAHELGYAAELETLSAGERLVVQVAARAAYAPVEQAMLARQFDRIDHLAGVEVVREGEAWLA